MGNLVIRKMFTARPTVKVPVTIEAKVCSQCHREKDKDEFYVQASCVGQRSPRCKTCHLVSVKARQKRLQKSKLQEATKDE